MPLPLLLVPLVAGGGGLSAATFLGSFAMGGGIAYGGYQATPYLYNGIRDWINPIHEDIRDNESLPTLLKMKEEKKKERLHHLDETLNDIQQRRKQLDIQLGNQKNKHQEIMDIVDNDEAQIKEQTLQVKQVNEELKQTACAQEELINRLQQELQEKMAAFEEAQRHLTESNSRLEKASQKLLLAESQVELSAKNQKNTLQELNHVKKHLETINNANQQKDCTIRHLTLEIKTMASEIVSYKTEIANSKLKINELTDEIISSNQLIDELSEKLEQPQNNKRNNSSSPLFFHSTP